MSVVLITYDLGDKTREGDLLDYMEENDATLVTESSYVLVTDKTPDEIKEEIKAITKKITVFVFTISAPWAGFGPTDVIDYLQKVLPQ